MPLTFVVSTGRCGSTMLSLILREHPEVLSLSEFFTGLKAVRRSSTFPDWEMDGRELWQILATPLPVTERLPGDLRSDAGPRYQAGSGRFDPGTGVPVICRKVLPTLSDDPDALFDRLAGEVPGWPRRPAADQYRALFGFLAGLLGRPVVVERSGASLPIASLLHAQFPEARFVHLHRDGPDCALSMSRRPAARRAALNAEAAQAAGLPPGASWREIQAALPERYRGLLTPPFDVRRLMEYPIPLTAFARRWSDIVVDGVAALRRLPADAWTSLSYERLLGRPDAELTRLAGFIGVAPEPGWLRAARQLVDPGRAGGAARLGPGELAALRDACRPGTEAIASVGDGPGAGAGAGGGAAEAGAGGGAGAGADAGTGAAVAG